jgi:hypothetical protein
MKWITLFLGLTLISLCTYGNESRVKKYYSHINNAENCLVKNQFEKARCYYKKAFELNSVFFGRDLRNALYVEQKIIPDSAQLYLCFTNYVKIGLNPKYISETYKSFYGLPYWHNIQKYLDTISTNFNTDLEAQLLSVFESDQAIRDYCIDFCPGNYLSCDFCRDTVNQVDSINLYQLIDLYKNNRINELTVRSEVIANFARVILLHNHKSKRAKYLFEEIKLQVKLGNFDARSYAEMYDNYYLNINKGKREEGYFGTRAYLATPKFFLVHLPANKKMNRTINRQRREIFLRGDYVEYNMNKFYQYQERNSKTTGLKAYFILDYFQFAPEVEQEVLDYYKTNEIKYKILYGS